MISNFISGLSHLTKINVYSYLYEHTPTGSLKKCLVDNLFRDKVVPKRGAILHCSMFGVEHTGVYIGSDTIIDLNGNGLIDLKTPKEFISGTNAVSIYVACNGMHPLYKGRIADNAISQLQIQKSTYRVKDYHLLSNNCHKFVSNCISGDFLNNSSINTFLKLEHIIRKEFQASKFNWRVWDLERNMLF